MKGTLLTILVGFLFLASIASAAVLEVGVKEKIEANLSSMTFDNSSNMVRFSFEVYNTGSVPYKARIKDDVSNSDDVVFSGWSQESDLMPGDKKDFDIYWYASSAGDYSSKVKIYFGDDVKEYKKVDLTVSDYKEPEDVFNISNFRTYDNYVVFDLSSKEDAENVVIIPQKYTPGWIFEQREIENMSQNSSKTVVLNYQPALWLPSNVSIGIASDNGKYYSERMLEMEKAGGIASLFYYIVDSLKIAFSK
jgi:hypothetical protein